MEENSIIKDKKDKMLMIVIGCLSVVLILLFIFFLVERSENKKHIAAIHEEKQLLEQSQESISQIAYQVGLSPKQFAKYFKEEFGCLPSEFNCKKD